MRAYHKPWHSSVTWHRHAIVFALSVMWHTKGDRYNSDGSTGVSGTLGLGIVSLHLAYRRGA